MYPLNFPSYDLKITRIDGKLRIFDVVRKKFVFLSPEEWVRQHVVHYLIETLEYPRSLIKTESGLKYNKMSKRSDIVVYARTGNVYLLVECKAPTVKIDQRTFDQLSVYNQYYKARYLALTNGLDHILADMRYKSGTYKFLKKFPSYKDDPLDA